MKETILNHPLIDHKISILRNYNTGTKEFRELISEISTILIYEAMRDAKLQEIKVTTPLGETKGYCLDEDEYAFIPILRAGLGMVEGVLKILPNAKIGHIGLERNEETLAADSYYYKVPSNIGNRTVFLLDPMLATGGSAVAAIDALKNAGVKNIKFIAILSAPEGIDHVKKHHPDVAIYSATLESHLNDKGYIVPGLGDAGDRIFGTNCS